MADNPGLDFLRDVAKDVSTVRTTPVDPPRAEPNPGSDFLNEVANPPTSGVPTASSFEGSPAIPLAPPTRLQKAAAPIVKGVSALGDLGNMIGAEALGGSDRFNPFKLLSEPSEGYKRFLEDKNRVAGQMSQNIGPKGSIYSWARQLGVVPEDENWSPTDWLSRSMYDTTNLATQFLTGGVFGKLLGTAKAIPGTVSAFGRPVATATPPVLTKGAAAMEMSMPVAGGVAGGTAHAIAPDNHVAEDLAMAGGSMAPLLATKLVPRALLDVADHAYNFFSRPSETDTGKRLAAILGKHPRELLDEFTAARPAAPEMPGWVPSPGAITGNTGLLAQERRAADKPLPFGDPLNPGSSITPAELRQRNAEALQAEIPAMAPQGDPRLATTEMGDRITRVQDQAQRRGRQLTGEAEALDRAAQQAQDVVAAQLPPVPPGQRTGARAEAANRFYGALENAEDAAVTHGGRLFEAVDPERAATVPMYRLRDALDEVKRMAVERGRTDALPGVMRKPVDAAGRPVGDKIDDFLHNWETAEPQPKFLANVPYERIKGLRTRLTEAQRALPMDARQEREFYGRLISGVDQAVAESTAGGLAERYSLARDFWREHVAQPFREGPVATILRNDKNLTGAGTLLAPGERGGQNVAQLVPTIRRDPELYRATVDYARADMTAFTTDVNGRVNGAKLKEWVDKHSPVLQHFPELQQEFGRLAQAQRTADQYLNYAAERSPALRALAERGIKNTEDTIRNSAAKFYLNAEPEDVVMRLASLRGSARAKAAEQAMGMLKSREAKEGLQRAYYDYVKKRVLGGDEREAVKGGWKSTFTKLLDEESDLANVMLPAGVRSRMKSLDKAMHMENARQGARANEGARTAEDLGGHPNMLHSMVQALKPDLPTLTGGATAGAVAGSAVPVVGAPFGAAIGATGAVAARHLILARQAAKEAALREAIFNPDIYEKVMSSASLAPAVRNRMNKAIRPYLIIANTEAAADGARDANQ